jgi:hypothetical protein
MVNHRTNEVQDRRLVIDAEQAVYEARFGKFDSALFERLNKLSSSDLVSALLIVGSSSADTIAGFETRITNSLGAKYPEVREAIRNNRMPFDINDQELSERVYFEYLSSLRVLVNARTNAFTTILDAQKVSYHLAADAPAVVVNVSKQELLRLAQLPNVSAVLPYNTDEVLPTAVGDSLYASDIHRVWDLGYTGEGTSVAVIEPGYADTTSVWSECAVGTNNCFKNLGMFRQAGNVSVHATGVSSVIASSAVLTDSFGGTFGVAPDTTLIRAGSSALPFDLQSALAWALSDAQADVANSSWCQGETTGDLTYFDWYFDYYARLANRLLVNASGNKGDCTSGDFVQPPARGWNVLTVGAYDDNNTQMWTNSQWKNPTSGTEKPDVVAPGVGINFVAGAGFVNSTGTSLATPQVTGIVALLFESNSQLIGNPTAAKALLMATATTNVDGSTGMTTGYDSKDGAGGVNALHAIKAAENRGTYTNTCEDSCWIAEALSANDFTNHTRTYGFYANTGDRIRIATAWWGKAEISGVFNYIHEMETDLDISLTDPDGMFVPGSYSFGAYGSVELIPQQGYIIAPKAGYYELNVYSFEFPSEGTNLVGIAYHREPAPTGSGVISGETWYDEDLNGVRGDPLIEYETGGLEVTLYEDANNNGVFEPEIFADPDEDGNYSWYGSDRYVSQVVSDYEGQYVFAGIKPGNYWVQGSIYYVNTTNPVGVITLGTSGLVDNVDFGTNSSCIGCS